MKIKTGIQAGTSAPGVFAQENLILDTLHVSKSSTDETYGHTGSLPGLDDFFHNTLAELKLWSERMNRKYGSSGRVAAGAERFWELDMLRGLALTEMLLVHFIKSWVKLLSPSLVLSLIGIWTAQKVLVEVVVFVLLLGGAWALSPLIGLDANNPLFEKLPALSSVLPFATLFVMPFLVEWMTIGSGAAGFFLFSGMSMSLNHDRKGAADETADNFGNYLRRGATLLGFGMAITALTLWLAPATPIWFGTLHLLGFAAVAVYPFLDLPAWANFASALGIIGLEPLLTQLVKSPALLWLVTTSSEVKMLDYWPVVPCFAIVLLGVAIGKLLYKDGQRNFEMPDLSDNKLVSSLAWIGRHSLPIYLTQMPLTLAGIAAAA